MVLQLLPNNNPMGKLIRNMKKQIIYFTFNDPPNGVYNSQVIDVVNFINTLDKDVNIRLFALISPRSFKKNKVKIKALNPQATVLPTIAPLKYWYLNKLLLWIVSLFISTKKVICRGPLATCLALNVFKKAIVVYDGRGAVVAEHEEYGVFENSGLEKQLFEIEKKAVLNSDFRIAVTEKLTNYWKERFFYNSDKHFIIPCTVSDSKTKTNVPQAIKSFILQNKNKVIYTFAGGNGKWQGIDLMIEFLSKQFDNNEQAAALLLCPINNELKNFQKRYNERLLITTVEPEQVNSIICQCDYGLLLRHSTITNKVASPVKIAEYLQAGLKVIISSSIGDYSNFIEVHKLGYIHSDNETPIYNKVPPSLKDHCKNIVESKLRKNSKEIKLKYKSLLK
ncbi:glycosyl transferase [Plebeiibacterium marinum]|uniref:Glycosyl transferase n=1 Tax=Plebeiibacterium marinum TaxID=2992111 RepID=A0AAE3SLD0_9BACT|nr:glycosyl transferase [Plebeiobacterium marinum]MCW3807473.1 glycosyl transferase [Plebeiobacterium marinum]